jgi:general secretion pathway protein A
MYEQFYGLKERPFDLTPNPRFLFMTSGHRDALAAMQYAISGRKGLTMVLGPPGTGKTTLVHAAMARQERNVRAVYLGNPTLTREEFFEFLAQELGLSPQAQTSKAQFLRELRADLVARHAQGTLTALVIDEAQAMSDGLLEELRLLENLETPSEKLLPVVLVGQPELATRLRQPALLPLRQRVALRFSLMPLSHPEVVGYISERIRIAGGDVFSVFSPEAIDAVCQSCGGIPRNISVVCDNALVNGFALDERPISAAVIAEVCRDFELPLPRGARLEAAMAPPATNGTGAPALVPTAVRQPAAAIEAVPFRPQPMAQEFTAIALRRADVPVMTNLAMSEAPAVESLMMDPLPSAHDAQETRTLLGRVTSPVRHFRSRFSKGSR